MVTQKKQTAQSSQQSAMQPVTLNQLGLAEPVEYASPKAFAVIVRSQLQNWRQGTVASKGRSDVARSNKKPWKQKGTGRARAGSARSPLWRGGGITFGPQPRVKTLRSLKQHRKDVMQSMCADYIKNGKVMMMDWQQLEKPKTATAYDILRNASLDNKKVLLFVHPHDFSTYASFANIPNVHISFFDHPNAFELAHADCWLFLKNDFDTFKEMVAKWS